MGCASAAGSTKGRTGGGRVSQGGWRDRVWAAEGAQLARTHRRALAQPNAASVALAGTAGEAGRRGDKRARARLIARMPAQRNFCSCTNAVMRRCTRERGPLAWGAGGRGHPNPHLQRACSAWSAGRQRRRRRTWWTGRNVHRPPQGWWGRLRSEGLCRQVPWGGWGAVPADGMAHSPSLGEFMSKEVRSWASRPEGPLSSPLRSSLTVRTRLLRDMTMDAVESVRLLYIGDNDDSCVLRGRV